MSGPKAVEATLDEGRNRHLRRLLAALDAGVLRLVRVRVGALDGRHPRGQAARRQARSTHALHFGVLNMDHVLRPDVYRPSRVLNMRDLGKDLCSRDLEPAVRALFVYGANPVI